MGCLRRYPYNTCAKQECQVEIQQIIKKTSIIDNREVKNLNQSIIDRETVRLRTKLNDETLSAGFVAKILKRLSEYQINSYADYAVRKGNHSGKSFVGLCEKMMR